MENKPDSKKNPQRYIAKCPIRVDVKKYNPRSRGRWQRGGATMTPSQFEDYRHDKKRNGYAYLEYDKAHNIRFVIRIKDKSNRSWIKINIAKWYIYEMLLYHLTLRPIQPLQDSKLWLRGRDNPNRIMNLENLKWEQVQEDYLTALENVRLVVDVCSGKARQKADEQLRRLIEHEDKINLLNEIEKGKKLKPTWDSYFI